MAITAVTVFHGLDVESPELEHEIVVEHEHGYGDAQPHDGGDQRLPDACREQSRIGSRVFGDGAEDGDHAEHGSEEPEQGRDDGNEFDPAQAFRDTGEVPVEEVGDFRPDVFGVFAVCLRDVAYDTDEWVVAGVDDIVPVSYSSDCLCKNKMETICHF